MCGKVLGQPCGGMWGIIGACEKGLVCVTKDKPRKLVHFEVGTCGKGTKLIFYNSWEFFKKQQLFNFRSFKEALSQENNEFISLNSTRTISLLSENSKKKLNFVRLKFALFFFEKAHIFQYRFLYIYHIWRLFFRSM